MTTTTFPASRSGPRETMEPTRTRETGRPMPDDTTTPRVDADEFALRPWPPFRWLNRHPKVSDTLIIALAVAPQIVALIYAGGAQPWTAYATVALTGLALIWRRSHPAAVLIAISLAGTIHPATNQTVALAFAVYTVASRFSLGRTAAVAGASLAVSAAGAFIRQLMTQEPVIPSSVLDPFVLVALAIGIAVRGRRAQREAVTELINQRIENARTLERTRIAAEMHDVVAHSLSVMIALANGAATAWQKHPERSADALEHLSAVGRGALTDMQRVLHLLRDSDADLDAALHESGHNLPDLGNLVEVFQAAGLPVVLTRTGNVITDDPALNTTVYRIAQESLTNALRYATGATRVELSISRHEDMLRLQVTDDGTGTTTGHQLGSKKGLIGIRERATAYEGELVAGRTATGGWQTIVTLRVPQTGETTRDE